MHATRTTADTLGSRPRWVAILAVLVFGCQEYTFSEKLGVESIIDTATTTPAADQETATLEDTGCRVEDEVCDGRDNDCDGEVDENLWQACTNCLGGPGKTVQCVDGAYEPCPVPMDLDPQILDFPETVDECLWGTLGNLTPVDGGLQARHDQSQRIWVPDGTLLCSLEIESTTKVIQFDDHLFLTLNGIYLLGSVHIQHLLTPIDEFYQYRWTDIAGVNNNTLVQEVFCASGHSTCELPQSQTKGTVSLTFSPSGNQALMDAATDLSSSDYMVGLTMTGDNDRSDCQHSGLRLEARVTYEERD